jgi:hypothetical protein
MPFALTSRSARDATRPVAGGVKAKSDRSRVAGGTAMALAGRLAVLQPKLQFGATGDRFEREADRIAEAVLRTPERAPCASSLAHEVSPSLQKSCCPTCADEQEALRQVPLETGKRHLSQSDNIRQRAQPATFIGHRPSDSRGEGHRPAPGVSGGATGRDFERGLSDLRGRGRPLPPDMRAFFEPRLGRGLGEVSIHTETRAATLASTVGARAFTLGSDIVFGRSEYRPDTPGGRRLLAHELVHVVQQGGDSRARSSADTHVRDSTSRRLQGQFENPPGTPSESQRDLSGTRFQGDPVLEAVARGERVVMRGHRGNAVTSIQAALIDAAFPLPRFGADGIFGSETEQAVKQFQASEGLTGSDLDGIVGPITLILLAQTAPGRPGPERVNCQQEIEKDLNFAHHVAHLAAIHYLIQVGVRHGPLQRIDCAAPVICVVRFTDVEVLVIFSVLDLPPSPPGSCARREDCTCAHVQEISPVVGPRCTFDLCCIRNLFEEGFITPILRLLNC